MEKLTVYYFIQQFYLKYPYLKEGIKCKKLGYKGKYILKILKNIHETQKKSTKSIIDVF